MELKNYQKDAVERLTGTVETLLKSSENEICVFQAPTGSGKTIMAADFLANLIKNREDQKKFSFVWISVRKLHDQSKDKLERFYEHDQALKCSYFEDLEDNQIGENEILFINWHSINKKDLNVYVRENEQDNNLRSVIENTKEEGREVILIIDESHHTATSDRSLELIETISPNVTIEVSATPHLKERVAGITKLNLSEVKEEEMIKTEISINPEFMDLRVGPKSSDEVVIEQAIKKREDLVKKYKKEGSNVNPLVLIQLPDRKQGLFDKQEDVLEILKKHKITEENGKLAVWLSEKKSDSIVNIDKNDNEVEFLVFKQAIALGWDCPRASILVILRETKSFTFTIQTVGRIMRMSELKHYLNEPELNKGFIFTNLTNIEIAEDYVKDYVTVYESRRKKEYKNISLPSIYLRRQRERTRLSGEFAKIFIEVAKEMKLDKKITLRPSKVVQPVIADGKILDIDRPGLVSHKGKVDMQLSDKETQAKFDEFIRSNASPFAPADSSDRMKTAIYQYFNKKYKLAKYDPRVQRIVLGKENVQAFVDAINLAKERYNAEIIKQLKEKRELKEVPKWEIPVIISYNSKYKKENHKASVMQPLFVRKPSEPEKLFMEALDKSKKVKWWFRNGESEIKYFAVLYQDEAGYERAFYVDFIVLFEDGTLGLFDTKSGMTAKDAGTRAEGLQKYIKAQNKKGKKLWGGIAVYINGSWKLNDKDKYNFDPNDLSSWKILEL